MHRCSRCCSEAEASMATSSLPHLSSSSCTPTYTHIHLLVLFVTSTCVAPTPLHGSNQHQFILGIVRVLRNVEYVGKDSVSCQLRVVLTCAQRMTRTTAMSMGKSRARLAAYHIPHSRSKYAHITHAYTQTHIHTHTCTHAHRGGCSLLQSYAPSTGFSLSLSIYLSN